MRRTKLLLTVMGTAVLLTLGPVSPAQSAESTSEALFTISHGTNRDIKSASTYTTGTFKIKNNSPNGQKIKKLRLEADSAVLPDLVFDPKGTAGDDVGKCFTADSGTSAVGLVAPANPCSDPFSDPLDGGYRTLTLDFSDFGPGETFTFSFDTDPTSINGSSDPGPNASGSVSGLELTGSEATVEFDDGSVRSGETFRIPDSPHSSRNTLKAGAPSKPSIEVLGTTAPGKVTDANQTVRVSGPAGSTASLMVLEAGLFTEGVPNGGHDLDAYEANSALAVSEKTAQIGSEGYVDVPVALSRSNAAYGGLNHLVAVTKDSTGRSSPNSDTLVLELEHVPPQTTIDSGPADIVSSDAATFGFSSSKPSSTFECSLDGATFAGCSSPQQYADLSDGEHTFSVRARDNAGIADPTPASRTWTVDTAAPTVGGVAPEDGSTGVAITANVTASFSDSMDASTIKDSTFTLTKQGDATPLAAAVSYDAETKKATLNANADLDPDATYTATIKGGTGGVEDAAGNPLAEDKTWSFTTDSLESTSEALFTISHGTNRDIKSASTYTTGTFKIKNNSPNGQKIKRLSVDAGSTLLPDLVFDPNGTAGDDVGKCFTADSGTSATGLVAPADPCSDPFSDPLDGGYRTLTLDFSDFGPGETFTFSSDMDPTSINGSSDPGPNHSGEVSGLELTGSEATVEFDDSSVRSGETFRIPDSPHSSHNTLKAGAPPKPSIEVLGTTAPGKVTDANQTVRVSGHANSSVSLMVAEAGMFTEGTSNGGFDLDPYEANSALAVSEKTAQIGSEGYVDVPVALTRTDTVYGGLNHLVAVTKDSTGRSSPNSDTLVLELEDSNTCTIKGTNGDDTLVGTSGDDIICGYGGIDIIEGLGGNDKIFGGDGGDQLLGGAGDDTIDGGLGNGKDVADFSKSPAPVTASLLTDTATGEGNDTIINVESLAGSPYADQLTGNDEGNVIRGHDGDDKIWSYGGPDELRGGFGNDSFLGGEGDDVVDGHEGIDTVSFKDSAEGITASLESDTATGEGYDALIEVEHAIGSSHADDLEGGSRGNRLTGLGGNDTLSGLGGNDVLSGGEGDDTIDGGMGTDTASFKDSAVGVEASLETNTATGEGSDTLTSVESLLGSARDDKLTGSSGANQLKGRGGNDTLSGLAGADTLLGDSGTDTLQGGSENDSLVGGTGNDGLYGEDGDDSLDSKDNKSGNDTLDGGSGTNTCTTDASEKSIINCQ